MPLADPWLPDPDASGYIDPALSLIPQKVYRINKDSASQWDWAHPEPLPNLDVLFVEEQLGAVPPTARVRYRLGTGDPADPQTWEQCLSDTADTARTVEPDDRIVITATRPDGTEEPYFDGRALGFQGSVQADREAVGIDLVGVAVHLWDDPIVDLTWRDPHYESEAGDVTVQVDGHFNPAGARNCLPGDSPDALPWSNVGADGDRSYPVFCDVDPPGLAAYGESLAWDYARLARYLLFRGAWDKDSQVDREEYVKFPAGGDLDEVLVARLPFDGVAFDPADPFTYRTAEIPAPDKPIGGKAPVDVLADIIQGKGFDVRLETRPADGSPEPIRPETTLEVILPQREIAGPMWLQPRGSTLDLALSQACAFTIGRDLTQVANAWYVEGELEEWELGIVLGPLFPSQASDATNPNKFDRGNPDYEVGTNPDLFRLFGADEAGEGHYAPASAAKALDPLNLDAILGKPVLVNDKVISQYAPRRRRPWPLRLTADSQGAPLGARLDISTDYVPPGGYPCVWDGSKSNAGTWQPCQGGWELLRDRIGVRLNCQNPNGWNIGSSADGTVPYPGGMVNLVEAICQANGFKLPYLRLTCVIRGDRRVRGTADRQLGTVLKHTVRRTIDAHDRYFSRTIAAWSPRNTTASPDVKRDDTDAATAEATAMQVVTQAGNLVGQPIVIPRFTRQPRLGTRISHIQGREVGFRTNGAYGDADSAPQYPVIVGRRHEFSENAQRTVIRFSDADASRHSYLSKINRRGGPRGPQR